MPVRALSGCLALLGGMHNQSFVFEKAPSALPRRGELAIFVGTNDELRPLMPNLPPAAANSASSRRWQPPCDLK